MSVASGVSTPVNGGSKEVSENEDGEAASGKSKKKRRKTSKREKKAAEP